MLEWIKKNAKYNTKKYRISSLWEDDQTSQDRFQQKQYKKQVQVKRSAQKRQQVKTNNNYQVPEVVVTAKRPAQKRSTSNTNSSRRERTTNTSRRTYNTRQRNVEPELPLLNNPNYIDSDTASGIRFIPNNFDGYMVSPDIGSK